MVAVPPCIAVVEDDVQTARLYEEFLSDAPACRLTCLGEGVPALAYLAAEPAGLLMLDLDLPALDGAAIYDRVRANPRTAALPVLFVTAREGDPHVRARGVTAVVRKPFRLDTLPAQVRALVPPVAV